MELRLGGAWQLIRSLRSAPARRKGALPLMRSVQPGEDWGWCYVDERFIEPAPRPARLS